MKLTWTCVGIFAVGTVAGIVGKNVYDKRKAKKVAQGAKSEAVAEDGEESSNAGGMGARRHGKFIMGTYSPRKERPVR